MKLVVVWQPAKPLDHATALPAWYIRGRTCLIPTSSASGCCAHLLEPAHNSASHRTPLSGGIPPLSQKNHQRVGSLGLLSLGAPWPSPWPRPASSKTQACQPAPTALQTPSDTTHSAARPGFANWM